MTKQRIDYPLRRRNRKRIALRRFTIDKPILCRFLEIIAALLPVFINQRRLIREIIRQVMRCFVRVFNNEPQSSSIEYREHFQRDFVIMLTKPAALNDLLDLILHSLVVPVLISAVEERHIVLTEVHTREKNASVTSSGLIESILLGSPAYAFSISSNRSMM